MERYPYGGGNGKMVKPDAIVSFVIGVVVAYAVQGPLLGLGGGGILTTLIVVAVGGLWYHWRRVI